MEFWKPCFDSEGQSLSWCGTDTRKHQMPSCCQPKIIWTTSKY